MYEEAIPDHKNVKVFKHVHDGPEVAKHGRRWPKSKCKRNKGAPHDLALDECRAPKYGPREWRDQYVYRRHRGVREHAYRGQRRQVYYTCRFCGKEETEWEWRDQPKFQDWVERL